ncbi:hypothetical protein E2562_013032 [Oryza meyeriana var. granulata]|uniref:DUF7771 domain-containing protein n=1 Tax=Oryza meyeriana var. granulata TaxID=110450 RepID=A0A6G1DIW1_9ORYZ|nr:hypothetical protein E2562_013032 [Oryza meyeriana var. granulata]
MHGPRNAPSHHNARARARYIRSSFMARRRLTAVTAAAIGVLLALASAPAAAASPPPRHGAESYYASVENRLPAAAGMELVCRALGAGFDVVTEFSVVPRGRVPRGGRRVAELLIDPGRVAWVLCSWGYEGNYLANLQLFDTQWPEAARCQDPAAAGGAMCRLVFEDGAVSVETPDGARRVVGDLPVKRCRHHWLLFSTGCSYPDHPHPYAGRLLRNALEFFAV